MRRVLAGIDTVSEWSGKLISMLVLLMTGLLLIEITLRYVFNSPTIWAHETSQHLFGAYSVLAGAYVLLHFQHVKVDLVYRLFSPRWRAILDSVTYLIFFLFIGVTLWYGSRIAWHSLQIGQHSATPFAPPLYPLKMMLPVGASLLLIQGIAHFIRSLTMAITRKELA